MGMDSGGNRPGGLTALAVLNFVIAGVEFLLGLGLLAALNLPNKAVQAELARSSIGLLYFLAFMDLASAGLLVASGIGYLGLKGLLGRGLGTLYGLVGLIAPAVVMVFAPEQFSIATVAGLVYPVFTLLLLNVTFRGDFRRDPAAPEGADEAAEVIGSRERPAVMTTPGRWEHLRLIGFHYAWHFLRGGTGILFTWALLFMGLSMASFILGQMENLDREVRRQQEMMGPGRAGALPAPTRRQVVDTAVRAGRPVVEWATGDPGLTSYFIHDKPALVSAILMLLLFQMPFFACLGGFNQLAGDIQHKGLRYLLLRTDRSSLFLGRFLGTLAFGAVVLAVLLLVIFLYLVFKADYYPAADVGLWLLRGYAALLLFSLPYFALCSWISAAVDSPLVSLVVSELLAFGVPLFVWFGTQLLAEFKYAGYVTPWPFKYGLLHPDAGHAALAALVMLAFTGLFVGLGLRTFRTRDL